MAELADAVGSKPTALTGISVRVRAWLLRWPKHRGLSIMQQKPPTTQQLVSDLYLALWRNLADAGHLKCSARKSISVRVRSWLLMASLETLFGKRSTTLDEVREIISNSYSKAQVLKSLGLGLGGANYRWLNVVISKYSISTEHFTGQGHLKGKRHNWNKRLPLEEILVKGSTYLNTSNLKRRLYKEGVLFEECYQCGQGPEWFGKRLVLHLDHRDGDPSNNEISNLQILCPNCHSQTKTYCGRNN